MMSGCASASKMDGMTTREAWGPCGTEGGGGAVMGFEGGRKTGALATGAPALEEVGFGKRPARYSISCDTHIGGQELGGQKPASTFGERNEGKSSKAWVQAAGPGERGLWGNVCGVGGRPPRATLLICGWFPMRSVRPYGWGVPKSLALGDGLVRNGTDQRKGWPP